MPGLPYSGIISLYNYFLREQKGYDFPHILQLPKNLESVSFVNQCMENTHTH